MMAGRVAVTAILAIFAVYPAKAGHHPHLSVVSAFRRIEAPQVFRAGVDLTTFGVTVTDRKGNLVTDLGKEDFEILETASRKRIKRLPAVKGIRTRKRHLG